MIKLFSKKVQVIPALKSVVSSGKVLMSTGAIVSETFTVINVGRRQHFTFKVSKRLNISITVLSLPDIYYSSPVQTVIHNSLKLHDSFNYHLSSLTKMFSNGS